ncbi:hypothetical protein C8R43DRAFT_946115 [Mycena crocata]|nr:hypothetical protein C8R43DRAFT_946115 [Mycena crocata]
MARTSQPSAHSTRNPAKGVIPARKRWAQDRSQAGRNTKALMTAMRKQRLAAYHEDIDEFYANRAVWITKTSQKHSKSEEQVRAMICNTTQFKSRRAPNLRNAIIHDRAVKAKEAGEHPKVLTDLQMELEDDIEDGIIGRLSEAEKKRLIDQLVEHRELHRQGARSTNKAAAVDAVRTELNIRDVLLDLYERTGVRGFAVFSRGNPDDTALPHSVDSDGSLDFLEQVFDISEFDFLRKFEQWCCTQDGGARDRNNGGSMRHQIVDMTVAGLRKITKKADAAMAYVDYNEKVRHEYHVELAGWPEKVPMQAPSKITSTEILRKLRDGLRSGAIHWVHMTKSQQNELALELEARREANGGTLKKRAPRSDKGKKRASRSTTAATATVTAPAPVAAAPVVVPAGPAPAIVTPAFPTATTQIPAVDTAAAPAPLFVAPAPIVTPAAPVFDEAFWDSLPDFDLTQFPNLDFNYVADPAPEFPLNPFVFTAPAVPTPAAPAAFTSSSAANTGPAVAANPAAIRTRKERSDKGKKRESASVGDGENAPPAKKRKVSKDATRSTRSARAARTTV